MTYNDLIRLYFDRSAALQWYWTLYVVVIGGLLGLSTLRRRADLAKTLIITVLFCCFAYKNLGAIEETMLQRSAIVRAMREGTFEDRTSSLGAQRNLLEPTLTTTNPAGTRAFHLSCDLLTIAAIWLMERRRRGSKVLPAP